MTRATQQRVLLEAAFVLHQRPYRDTSRIVELLTRTHGRLTVFSRGSRRAGSRLTAVLQPFNRVLVSFSGRGEAATLMHAEFDGPPRGLAATCLMSGFYLNELLIRLLARHDPQPEVFALYETTLASLRDGDDEAAVLRRFEKRLLEAIGYGLTLGYDVRSGAPVEAGRTYRFLPEEGPVETAPGVADGHCIVSGTSLIALAAEQLDDAAVRTEVRWLLRAALDRCLEGRGLMSRDVLAQMRRRTSARGGKSADK